MNKMIRNSLLKGKCQGVLDLRKKVLISPTVREFQNKTRLESHFLPITLTNTRMLAIAKLLS